MTAITSASEGGLTPMNDPWMSGGNRLQVEPVTRQAIQPVVLRPRKHIWTQNIEDKTEMSAVWPVEVEEIEVM